MEITINEVNKSEFCKNWTEEQKNNFLKCLDLISKQDHSGATIMFLSNFLNGIASEDISKEDIINRIKIMEMEKEYDEYYLDISIRKDVLDILEITQDKDVLMLIVFYIDYMVISPITFEDDKWDDLNKYGDSENLQHKECSAVFKETASNKIYYLDAIYFNDINQDTYFSSNCIEIKDLGRISSFQYIKGDSFLPKTFYLDIKLVDEDKEIYEICNPEVLEEIKDYYDFKCI